LRFVDQTNRHDLRNAGIDSFARLAGKSAAEGDYDQLRFVADKIKSIYGNLMDQAVSVEWESLPKPSKILLETGKAFATHCLARSAVEDRQHYTTTINGWLRDAYAAKCPALRDAVSAECVQTDTLHKMATNLMLERDKAVDNAHASARRILGPLGRRIADAKAQQIADGFLQAVPNDAFGIAAAHTARTLMKEFQKFVAQGSEPVTEIRLLVNMAGRVLPSDHPMTCEMTKFLAVNEDGQTLRAA
jgi:hypothetical protein